MTNENLPTMFFVRSYNVKNEAYRNSENLLGVGYDEINKILYIVFRTSRIIYNYLGVPKHHFDVIEDQTAMHKVSKGEYFCDNIRNYPDKDIYRYPYNRMGKFGGKDSDLKDYHP